MGSGLIGAALISCVSFPSASILHPQSFIIDSWSSISLHCCRKAIVGADIQGFNTNASKVASLVLGFFMLLILYWAYKSWTAWFSILITVGIIVICWLVASSVALRFFILFLGVMSCFYTIVRFAFFPSIVSVHLRK